MEDNSEIYIFLGFQLNTSFFVHTIGDNENFKGEISHQIYNVMMNNRQIIEQNENVIIYEFNNITKSCNVIKITHSKNLSNNIIDKDNLEDFFPVLIKAFRDDIFAIKYDYTTKGYYSYSIDDNKIITNLMESIKIPNEKLYIEKIYDVITTKPF
jgi:hypothetical protein